MPPRARWRQSRNIDQGSVGVSTAGSLSLEVLILLIWTWKRNMRHDAKLSSLIAVHEAATSATLHVFSGILSFWSLYASPTSTGCGNWIMHMSGSCECRSKNQTQWKNRTFKSTICNLMLSFVRTLHDITGTTSDELHIFLSVHFRRHTGNHKQWLWFQCEIRRHLLLGSGCSIFSC